MSQRAITQEQLNKEMVQMLIGGCARLVLTLTAISTVWATLVTCPATILLMLMVFRQHLELDNKANH